LRLLLTGRFVSHYLLPQQVAPPLRHERIASPPGGDFPQAVALPAVEQAVFLGRAGAGDAELQQRVEELLQAHLGARTSSRLNGEAPLLRRPDLAGGRPVLSIPESTAKRRWTSRARGCSAKSALSKRRRERLNPLASARNHRSHPIRNRERQRVEIEWAR